MSQQFDKMFCFQCEQTAGCVACSGGSGVCGKPADTANLQDELTGALIGLGQTIRNGGKITPETDRAMLAGLFTTVTNVNFDGPSVQAMTETVRQAAQAAIKATANDRAGATDEAGAAGQAPAPEYPVRRIWDLADEDIRSLKSLILFGLRGTAAYAYHALALGYTDSDLNHFFYEAMAALGDDDKTMADLLPLVLQVGEYNFKCMELLDQANTETYGTPTPLTVPLSVEKGPFIVVTGHDLPDLWQLLEQTKDKGINIYTHGEMLPAHAYPKLKTYPHLKGNFGTAWQNQQKEFDQLPAPILYTTNCIMPVRPSYADRVFTTGVVAYPEMVHIGEDKDFTPVIQKALELGGYPENRGFTGINGGTEVTTGFGHGAVLAAAGTIVEAVKAGAIKHFFLVGGCDGAKPGRNYYTDFVRQTPADTVILTLACGKYRFNDLNIGEIGGLPRILDMGQCNDAYSAIRVAVALAEAFECGVNDLPLTLVLSWYEQKAVCILLTLLYLGLQNIYLGPSLPAFVSPNVLNFLVENYHLTPISTPEADLKKILG